MLMQRCALGNDVHPSAFLGGATWTGPSLRCRVKLNSLNVVGAISHRHTQCLIHTWLNKWADLDPVKRSNNSGIPPKRRASLPAQKRTPLTRPGLVRMATTVANSRPVRQAVGSVTMSKCAARLASAIANPFDEKSRGACFPTFPAPDSHKVTAVCRLDGAIGTNGVGFIAINPSTANDMPSFFYSGAAFTGTAATCLTATSVLATGVFTASHNGPYATSQLVKGANEAQTELVGRVVTAGIRATYTGTTLNQSGMWTGLQHPAHGNLSSASNSDLSSFNDVDYCVVSRKPCTLAITPAKVEETTYATNESTNYRILYPFGTDPRFHTTYDGTANFSYGQMRAGVAVYAGAPIALLVITGVAGATFHIDAVVHLEYVGSVCASAATPNSVDVSSVYAILTAASQLGARRMASPNDSNWKLLMDGIRAAMGSPIGLSARGVIGALL